MSKTQVLTPKQKEFYDVFWQRSFIPGRVNWPSVREMMEHAALSSTSEANRYFDILVARGYLVQDASGEQRRLPGWDYVTRLEQVDDEVSE